MERTARQEVVLWNKVYEDFRFGPIFLIYKKQTSNVKGLIKTMVFDSNLYIS